MTSVASQTRRNRSHISQDASAILADPPTSPRPVALAAPVRTTPAIPQPHQRFHDRVSVSKTMHLSLATISTIPMRRKRAPPADKGISCAEPDWAVPPLTFSVGALAPEAGARRGYSARCDLFRARPERAVPTASQESPAANPTCHPCF